jgi:16S rRNA (uracil1498-N3)-methyltransferase
LDLTTLNIVLLNQTDFVDSQKVKLEDERFLHIRDIHKSQTGDSVRLGEINGLMGSGSITCMGTEYVELEVSLYQTPPKKLPLSLVLALPRPKMLRRVLRTVAELGVAELHLINSYRVEKSFWHTPVLEQKNTEKYLLQGLQQAKDTMLPSISIHPLFKPFVEDSLPPLIKNQRAMLAHPKHGSPCPHCIDEELVLIIGPEGGFIPYEVKKLLDAGCEGVHLGERILRVENAVSVLIAKLFS